jgi:hypothetical protein
VARRTITLRSRYVYAAVFILLGALLVKAASDSENLPLSAPLLWLALDLFLLSVAYLVGWWTLFGKTSDGSMRVARVVLMAPYLGLLWTIWAIQAGLSDGPAWNQIVPGIFVGRRCPFGKLPPGTSHVIDFTAEVPGDKKSRRTVKWLSIPVLDGCAPKPADYQKGFAFTDNFPESIVYVCCAKGHGRSATFAAALLLKKGIAHTTKEAIETVETRRHRASLNNGQIKSLERGDWR